MSIPTVSSLLDFSGKVVIVTGSGSGLGQGHCQALCRGGGTGSRAFSRQWRRGAACRQTRSCRGGSAVAIHADLTQEREVARLVEGTVEAFGRVDVLVNNAGIYPLASLLEMTGAQWDAVINADLRSAFLCTQAAATQMIKQDDGGAIVNITSIEAENPAPLHSHYRRG